MNRKDILDYARKTPTNTNVNVLGSMIDSVVRDSEGSGDSSGATTTESDVTFYDYDGTVVASFTKNEWLRQTSLPANPIHEGLVAQGWNWSKSDIDSYVSKYGKCNIGQMYNTASGDTEIDIYLNSDNSNFYMVFTELEKNCTVNWGDNSEVDTILASEIDENNPGIVGHDYNTKGYYTIKISGDNSYSFYPGSAKSDITNIRFSDSVKTLSVGSDEDGFRNSYHLETVTMPNGIIDINDSFRDCNSLQFITIPNTITTIKEYAFSGCSSLQAVSLPSNVTTIGGAAFCVCRCIKSILIPEKVTTIGESAFTSCNAAKIIVIPSSVTNIGAATLGECNAAEIIITPDISGSILSGNAPQALRTLILLNGITRIEGGMFYNFYALKTIVIPDGVTTIDDDFSECYSLRSITIPAGITYMVQGAFQSCGPYTIYAPANVVDEYKNGVFSEYADHIQPIPVE